MRKVAPKKMRMILMMREISHVSNIQYYNSEKDKKRTDAKHIINFFFFLVMILTAPHKFAYRLIVFLTTMTIVSLTFK